MERDFAVSRRPREFVTLNFDLFVEIAALCIRDNAPN